jgi:hypothetical protein
MIVNKDTNPERNLFYLGGLILGVLSETTDKKLVDFFDVFQRLNEIEKVSISLFSLALDWLYLIEAVDLIDGDVKKCF